MNSIKQPYLFFLGAGGIGMSALVRYFLAEGKTVLGYDKTPTKLTQTLIDEGLQIIFEDEVIKLQDEIIQNPENVLVIYTPAIPKDSKLLKFFIQNDFSLIKRAEALGLVTNQTTNLSVAGTHGKTTTSAILTSIFKNSPKQFYAFLGGISAEINSNYYYQKGITSEIYSITEADEFDRSFLKLSPNYAVITSTDADHLDIYGDVTSIESTFQEFADKIEHRSNLFYAYSKAIIQKGTSYSASHQEADFYAEIKESKPHGTLFDIWHQNTVWASDFYLPIAGIHNVENALGAILMAFKSGGISIEEIKGGLKNFKGIKRRFEFIFQSDRYTYIDDYAHHPNEIIAFLNSVKSLYPSSKITAIFQPHLFSRTNDFHKAFGESLALADEVILLPIYPARELPIPGVNSEMILPYINHHQKQVVEKSNLLKAIKNLKNEVILTIGAGDIDQLVLPIKNWIDEKK